MLECLIVIYVKSIQASTHTHTRTRTHLLENTQNDQEHFLGFIYIHTQRQVSLLLPPLLATFSTPTFLALATERLFAFAAERFLATLAFAFAACLFSPLSIPSLLGLGPESAQRTGDHSLRMTGLMSTFTQVFPCSSSQQ